MYSLYALKGPAYAVVVDAKVFTVMTGAVVSHTFSRSLRIEHSIGGVSCNAVWCSACDPQEYIKEPGRLEFEERSWCPKIHLCS